MEIPQRIGSPQVFDITERNRCRFLFVKQKCPPFHFAFWTSCAKFISKIKSLSHTLVFALHCSAHLQLHLLFTFISRCYLPTCRSSFLSSIIALLLYFIIDVCEGISIQIFPLIVRVRCHLSTQHTGRLIHRNRQRETRTMCFMLWPRTRTHDCLLRYSVFSLVNLVYNIPCDEDHDRTKPISFFNNRFIFI